MSTTKDVPTNMAEKSADWCLTQLNAPNAADAVKYDKELGRKREALKTASRGEERIEQ